MSATSLRTLPRTIITIFFAVLAFYILALLVYGQTKKAPSVVDYAYATHWACSIGDGQDQLGNFAGWRITTTITFSQGEPVQQTLPSMWDWEKAVNYCSKWSKDMLKTILAARKEAIKRSALASSASK